jgi:hypothetical protein
MSHRSEMRRFVENRPQLDAEFVAGFVKTLYVAGAPAARDELLRDTKNEANSKALLAALDIANAPNAWEPARIKSIVTRAVALLRVLKATEGAR